METIDSFISRKEFDENANKETCARYRLQASATTATCDRFNNCSTQAKKAPDCFTVISEHICFLMLVFFLFLHFLVVGSVR